MSSDLAQVELSHSGGITIASLSGEIDISTVGMVENALTSLPNVADHLVIDMTELMYLDSTAVALLHDIARRLRQRSQRLVVVAPPSRPPRRILELTALDETATVVDQLEPALETLHDSPWLFSIRGE